MTETDLAIVIVAAGRGQRAGGGVPKQWRSLAGMPVVAHSVRAFAELGRIILVVDPAEMEQALTIFGGTVALVAGGESRRASVRNALEMLDGSSTRLVLIHDAARPLVRQALIARVIEALAASSGAAPALAVTDALWKSADGALTVPVPRDGFHRAQTPQGFHFPAILDAHRNYRGDAADDAEIARAAGLDVAIVEGEEDNIKITWPGDFKKAEKVLAGTDIRIGNGFDVHAFTEGAHVILCGVRVAHDRALLGHSDADVAMHALTDALYGALGEGDIGRHFPPSEDRWKDAASESFLSHAIGRVTDRGYRLGNADITIVCERPKIGPHAEQMTQELARIMAVDPSRISVKATTSERLGFTGREEGIAALATVTLVAP